MFRMHWLLVAACALVAGGGGSMAPPQIIMIHGGHLAEPVFLTDLAENERFVLSQLPASGPPADTSVVLAVAFFYAPLTWARTARDSARLRALRPADADQVAQLLVSADGRDASIDFGLAGTVRGSPRYRRVGSAGIEILRLHGVLPEVRGRTRPEPAE